MTFANYTCLCRSTNEVGIPPSISAANQGAPAPAPAGVGASAPAPAPISQLNPGIAPSPLPGPAPSDLPALVGGIVGGVVGLLMLSTIIGVAAFLYRRNKLAQESQALNPWDPKEQRPLWKQLLLPLGTLRSVPLDSSRDATSTGNSWFTQELSDSGQKQDPRSNFLSSHFAVMRLEDLKLAPSTVATATFLQESQAYATAAATWHAETATTKDMAVMVDQDLPTELRSTWQINPDQLQLVVDDNLQPQTLGKGANGTVYLGVLDGVRKVAVKIVNNPSQQHQKRFLQEIATLRACYDENIVSFLGASLQEGNTLLVMQYMAHGDLWNALQIDRDGRKNFGWYKRGKKIALDIAAGISFLHRNQIVHLDLKSPNILLDEHDKAYVADIGLGVMITGKEVVAGAASFPWAAPEQLQGKPCSTASDIFSLGVIIWEIVTGEQPLQRAYRDVRVPEESPSEVAELLTACLSIEPSDRPSILQLYKTLREA